MDVVPAIKSNGWLPGNARKYSSTSEKHGCLLIPKKHKEIVNDMDMFNVSFERSESALFSIMPDVLKQAFILAKTISEIINHFYNDTPSTYILKTLTLHTFRYHEMYDSAVRQLIASQQEDTLPPHQRYHQPMQLVPMEDILRYAELIFLYLEQFTENCTPSSFFINKDLISISRKGCTTFHTFVCLGRLILTDPNAKVQLWHKLKKNHIQDKRNASFFDTALSMFQQLTDVQLSLDLRKIGSNYLKALSICLGEEICMLFMKCVTENSVYLCKPKKEAEAQLVKIENAYLEFRQTKGIIHKLVQKDEDVKEEAFIPYCKALQNTRMQLVKSLEEILVQLSKQKEGKFVHFCEVMEETSLHLKKAIELQVRHSLCFKEKSLKEILKVISTAMENLRGIFGKALKERFQQESRAMEEARVYEKTVIEERGQESKIMEEISQLIIIAMKLSKY